MPSWRPRWRGRSIAHDNRPQHRASYVEFSQHSSRARKDGESSLRPFPSHFHFIGMRAHLPAALLCPRFLRLLRLPRLGAAAVKEAVGLPASGRSPKTCKLSRHASVVDFSHGYYQTKSSLNRSHLTSFTTRTIDGFRNAIATFQ